MNSLKKHTLLFISTLLFSSALWGEPAEYNFLAKKEVQHFIDTLVKKYHFDRDEVTQVLKNAKYDQETLSRYQGKYKKGKTDGTWERYKAHVLDPLSLKKAQIFKETYYPTLLRAAKIYDVDLEYIVAFIGVESKFGEYTGNYHIIDSLATLAFHKNRMQKFFKSELLHLFLLSREEKRDIDGMYGSFAGAMGCVQQVPSVQRKFAMDFNEDGIKDPWDLEDCIGIIASFMHRKGWKKGGVVAVPTNFKGTTFNTLKSSRKKKYRLSILKKYGIYPTQPFNESKGYLLKVRDHDHDEVWIGGSNFRVLTRYNNSTAYGLGIHLIAESLK